MSDLVAGLEFRAGRPTDVDELVRMSDGPIANKGSFIVDSLAHRSVIVACIGDRRVGYLIWDRNFFGRPFVWLLGTDRPFRRRGIAAALLRSFGSSCAGQSTFVSTNESNRPMQRLLTQLGFSLSGSVKNIDPNDPELFYHKQQPID